MRLGQTSLLALSLLSMVAVLSLETSISAQQPGQPPALSPEQQKLALDDIRNTWEAEAKSLQSLYVQFLIETTDNSFGKDKAKKLMSYGEAKVLKMPTGQYGLKLETYGLDSSGRPNLARLERKYVCSGMWFYNFDIPSKTIIFQRMLNQNMRPDDGPFAFLFGMKATEANNRFAMSIVQQNKDYTWIRVNPLTAQDQRDFKVAQLGVVNFANTISPKFFPLRIMWQEPGGNEISWEFKSVVRNDANKVTMADFSVEAEKKAGWQLREAPAQGAAANNPAQGTPTGGAPRK